jgi:hypothetical protein
MKKENGGIYQENDVVKPFEPYSSFQQTVKMIAFGLKVGCTGVGVGFGVKSGPKRVH